MVLSDGDGDTLLHLREFQFKNVLKLVRTKRLEYYNLVQPVHELRQELSTSRLRRSPHDFVVQVRILDGRLYDESETTLGEPAHFWRSYVRCHKDDALGKVHVRIVAERESSFVQDSEHKLPQRLGGLLTSSNRKSVSLSFSVCQRVKASWVSIGWVCM